MWTKQNVFHEIGHKIKYWCWCKCQQNMPTEQCQFEKEIFHWIFYGITIILLMYQSTMLHKYKQNITFNVINTQTHTKKKNPWINKGWVIFPQEGSIFYLTPARHLDIVRYSNRIWSHWRFYILCIRNFEDIRFEWNSRFVPTLAYVTCSNEMNRMSAKLISRKHRINMERWILTFFDFLSPKYTLVSFLSIGNTYFSFILLFGTFYSLFRHTT